MYDVRCTLYDVHSTIVHIHTCTICVDHMYMYMVDHTTVRVICTHIIHRTIICTLVNRRATCRATLYNICGLALSLAAIYSVVYTM